MPDDALLTATEAPSTLGKLKSSRRGNKMRSANCQNSAPLFLEFIEGNLEMSLSLQFSLKKLSRPFWFFKKIFWNLFFKLNHN